MTNNEDDFMYSEIWAALLLTGPNLDPDEITAFVGMTPTTTWRKGDYIANRPPRRYEFGGWQLRSTLCSTLPHSADLEAHIDDVLAQLRTHWHQFVELGQRFDATIECVVKTYAYDRPAIGLRREVVKLLSELNAELDVDLYAFSAESARRRMGASSGAPQARSQASGE